VTIPALSAFKDSDRLSGGGLSTGVVDMEALLKQYSVREVVLVSAHFDATEADAFSVVLSQLG
jgi:hypothetical protein